MCVIDDACVFAVVRIVHRTHTHTGRVAGFVARVELPPDRSSVLGRRKPSDRRDGLRLRRCPHVAQDIKYCKYVPGAWYLVSYTWYTANI